MDVVTLILIVLTSFNLSRLAMKIWGDKFPQPQARNLHAAWLQGWRYTLKPMRRFWVQIVIMFTIFTALNIGGEMFAGFLVFVRLIVFCVGYKRARQQIAQPTVAPAPTDLRGSLNAISAHAQDSVKVAAATDGAPVTVLAEGYHPPSSKRRPALMIVGGIAVIGAILGLGFFVRSGESSPPNAADQQVEDAVNKAFSDPVVMPAPAESVSASASPPQVGEAATATTTSVQQANPTPSQRDTPPLTYAAYGNVVASYFPGEPAEDAVADALSKLNSALSVSAIDYLGYPVYALECEKDGQCVNGTGTPFGSTVEVAREMFAVNPSDVQKYALKCEVVCRDSQGQIIGSAP